MVLGGASGAAGGSRSGQATSAFGRLCRAIFFRLNDFVDGVFQILRMGTYLFSEAWLCVCVCHVTLLALRNTNRVFSICAKVFKFSSGRASNCGLAQRNGGSLCLHATICSEVI